MKIKHVCAVVGAVLLAAPVAASAAPAEYKVTGGGQVFTSSSLDDNGKPPGGPGDTIAFQAFVADADSTVATGQVNIVDREVGAGGKGAHYKGQVTCAFIVTATEDAPGFAELRGMGSVKGQPSTVFKVRISDDGQGQDTMDLVEFNRNFDDGDDDTSDEQEAAGCEDSQDDPFATALARGNAKIHKAKSSDNRSQRSSWLRTLKLAGLR